MRNVKQNETRGGNQTEKLKMKTSQECKLNAKLKAVVSASTHLKHRDYKLERRGQHEKGYAKVVKKHVGHRRPPRGLPAVLTGSIPSLERQPIKARPEQDSKKTKKKMEKQRKGDGHMYRNHVISID